MFGLIACKRKSFLLIQIVPATRIAVLFLFSAITFTYGKADFVVLIFVIPDKSMMFESKTLIERKSNTLIRNVALNSVLVIVVFCFFFNKISVAVKNQVFAFDFCFVGNNVFAVGNFAVSLIFVLHSFRNVCFAFGRKFINLISISVSMMFPETSIKME